MLKNQARITSYLMSMLGKQVSYGYGGGELQGVASIYHRKIGVVTEQTFVPASLISHINKG